jgi:hypothetical protein
MRKPLRCYDGPQPTTNTTIYNTKQTARAFNKEKKYEKMSTSTSSESESKTSISPKRRSKYRQLSRSPDRKIRSKSRYRKESSSSSSSVSTDRRSRSRSISRKRSKSRSRSSTTRSRSISPTRSKTRSRSKSPIKKSKSKSRSRSRSRSRESSKTKLILSTKKKTVTNDNPSKPITNNEESINKTDNTNTVISHTVQKPTIYESIDTDHIPYYDSETSSDEDKNGNQMDIVDNMDHLDDGGDDCSCDIEKECDPIDCEYCNMGYVYNGIKK